MSILQELGIDTGDLAKACEAVHEAVEPAMEGFKQAAEEHKQKVWRTPSQSRSPSVRFWR